MRCIYNYNNCADTLCLDDESSDKPENGDFVWTFDLNNKPPNYLKSRTQYNYRNFADVLKLLVMKTI